MVHALCRPSDRITTLNVLQGLVLPGLLIAQVFDHPQPGHPLPLNDHHPDLPAQFVVQLLVAGQFDRLGSFLVGLGFYRCWQKTTVVEMVRHRIARRLGLLLLGIGLVFSLLQGSIDLLVPYALLGLTLPYFVNQSVSSLIGWMVAFTLVAMLLPSGLGLLYPARVSPQAQVFSPYFSYELMMLGGLLVGRLRVLPPNPQLRVRLSLLQVVTLPAAFVLKGAWVALTLGLIVLPPRVVAYQPMLLALTGFWGTLLLTSVYLLDVGINARLTPFGWTRWLGVVGQLSLTNYVLQSILCPLLLYGYGLALSGSPTYWERAAIIMGIYGFQIGFSLIWSKRYQQGPLEWLCRQWVYGKWGQWKTASKAKL